MAINPESQYPGKIAPSSSAYPYGQARNITVPGDGTGTPWEAALVNDIFGFQQALLSEGAVVPSGSPDQVGASQYLQAAKKVFSKNVNGYTQLKALDSSVLANGTHVVLAYRDTQDDGGGGSLVWVSSDLSTEVASDTEEGNYIPPDSDPTGASGAYVRAPELIARLTWFGAALDGTTDDSAAFEGLSALVGNSGHMRFAFNSVKTIGLASSVAIDSRFITSDGAVTFKALTNSQASVLDAKENFWGLEKVYVDGGGSGKALIGFNAGPDTNLGRNASFSSYATDCRFENVPDGDCFTNKGVGGGVGRESVDMRLTRCWFRNGLVGCRLRQPDHQLISCLFKDNVSGLAIEDNTKVTVQGAIFSENDYHIDFVSSLGGKGEYIDCWFENGVIFRSVASMTLNGPLKFQNCHMASPVATNPTYCLDMDNIIRGNVCIDSSTFANCLTQNSINVTAATNAAACRLTATAHGRSSGDLVYVDSLAGMTELNGRIFVVVVIDANTLELYNRTGATDSSNFYATSMAAGAAEDSTGYGTYTSGGTITLAQPFRLPRCNVVLSNCFARTPAGLPQKVPVQGDRGDLANLTMIDSTNDTSGLAVLGGTLELFAKNNAQLQVTQFGSHGTKITSYKPGNASALWLEADGHVNLDGGWDTTHWIMNGFHIWVDTTGDLRIKSSAPTSDTDGTVVGTQT